MKASVLKKKYLEFFKKKGHAIIQSAPVIPEHDASTLFISAGMHPLVPFLLGQPHPRGKRLANVQKSFRTGDIEDVGDDTHNTFFEMLGNWSLGDYFKKETLTWSYEFLIKEIKLDPTKISVTVFAGNKDVPRDEEAANIWIGLGIPKERIYFLPEEDNFWWAGDTGPCGPDSEIFVDSGKPKCGKKCKPGCGCGKYFEIWNNVFMTYNRDKNGKYIPLKQKNIDTGLGVERTIAILQGKQSIYETELFAPLMLIVRKHAKSFNEKSARVIVDHARAATFILGDERGVTPSNNDQGYILRRLIRRAIRHARLIGVDKGLCQLMAKKVIQMYSNDYPILKKKQAFILSEVSKEEARFLQTLEKGLRRFEKIATKNISGKDAFLLFQSFGFPIEMTVELAQEKGLKVDSKCFYTEYEKHQKLSRKGAEQKFKGGLADASKEVTRLHTATHLLAQALRQVLGKDIKQKGSNITSERLRFDFNFDRKVTREELDKVEVIVNQQIKKGLSVNRELMPYSDAKKLGVQAEFEHKYSEKIYVYFIGDFSKEVCGGPHVSNVKELGKFKILKEQSIAAGVRRIKAILI